MYIHTRPIAFFHSRPLTPAPSSTSSPCHRRLRKERRRRPSRRRRRAVATAGVPFFAWENAFFDDRRGLGNVGYKIGARATFLRRGPVTTEDGCTSVVASELPEWSMVQAGKLENRIFDVTGPLTPEGKEGRTVDLEKKSESTVFRYRDLVVVWRLQHR